MLLDLAGWFLASAGLAGLCCGCRRARFATEAAEYLPACLLLQGAALTAWVGYLPLWTALLRFAVYGLAALLGYALLRGMIVLPPGVRRVTRPDAALLTASLRRSGS